MQKIRKILWITLAFVVVSLLFFFTACSTNTAMAKTIKQLKSEIPQNSFQKIAEYIKTHGEQKENNKFSIKNSKLTPGSTTLYIYYQEIIYSTDTDRLYLKGIARKSTTVTLEIPNLQDYSNHTYKYSAEYQTQNDKKKDVTLKATFSVPAQIYTSAIDKQALPTLELDEANQHLSVSIGRDKFTNFQKNIPSAIEEAEVLLKEIFTKVTNVSSAEIQDAYKLHFCLPTFENPLAMPAA